MPATRTNRENGLTEYDPCAASCDIVADNEWPGLSTAGLPHNLYQRKAGDQRNQFPASSDHDISVHPRTELHIHKEELLACSILQSPFFALHKRL